MDTFMDTAVVGRLRFAVIRGISSCAGRPSTTTYAPPGWKILGGGAFVNWTGPCAPPAPAGNLLTGVFPNEEGTTWTATSKDHLTPSAANIVAYAIVAQFDDGSPISHDDYTIVSNTSGIAPHPSLTVPLPEEFAVVGGGARANYTGLGSMLYATYPVEDKAWFGAAKDHLEPDPSTITVWAIGLRRSFLGELGLFLRTFETTSSPPVPHPHVVVDVPDEEFHITGGGACVNWDVNPSAEGSLLTATYPGADNKTWVADGKDHIKPDPSTITAWAIAVYVLYK
jgi:hypothetical protein